MESDSEGEVVFSDPIPILPALEAEDPNLFFGVPDLASIQPLSGSSTPELVQDYYDANNDLIYYGGYFSRNSTLQFAPSSVSPFALQVGVSVVSNITALVDLNSTISGITTYVQQLPYISEVPFRSDILFISFCLSFGFSGLAFSVIDILLLKSQNVIELFRTVGISEWTTYMGVMCYKSTTTFLPFFFLTIVLGLSTGLVLFGSAGRWLGTILLMIGYAYSSTPMGLLLAKRFIHGELKQVTSWFPG